MAQRSNPPHSSEPAADAGPAPDRRFIEVSRVRAYGRIVDVVREIGPAKLHAAEIESVSRRGGRAAVRRRPRRRGSAPALAETHTLARDLVTSQRWTSGPRRAPGARHRRLRADPGVRAARGCVAPAFTCPQGRPLQANGLVGQAAASPHAAGHLDAPRRSSASPPPAGASRSRSAGGVTAARGACPLRLEAGPAPPSHHLRAIATGTPRAGRRTPDRRDPRRPARPDCTRTGSWDRGLAHRGRHRGPHAPWARRRRLLARRYDRPVLEHEEK